MFDLPNEILAALTMAAFFAGFVDSIAGGGGLVTVPALLLAGLSPLQALGTNKLQGLFGAGAAALSYARKGHVSPKSQLPSALIAFAASTLGALSATFVPEQWFRSLMPIVLVGIAVYFWLKPGLDDIDRKARLSTGLFVITLVPLVAFYDGLFGPGTGSFFMLGFVALGGYGILKATAHTKLLNFASNIGGFVVFASVGAVAWQLGLLMGVAQIAGAFTGSRLAMKNGAKIIKPLLVITCFALAARLLFA